MDRSISGRRRLVSAWLLAAGMCLLVLGLAGFARSGLRQDALKRGWAERPTLPAGETAGSDLGRPAASAIAEGQPVARIRIPRVGLDAVVLEGISDATLAQAPGHYPGMALPGEGGHVVLAAHRDSFFKDLGKLEDGDAVTLTRRDGREVSYRVSRSYIVHKTNRTVIVPVDHEVLTLITCYPFQYVGHAPYRYIVEAVPAS
jgi:sortase A